MPEARLWAGSAGPNGCLNSTTRRFSAFAKGFEANPQGHALLSAVFAYSPFLTHCLLTEPQLLQQLMTDGPDKALEFVEQDLRQPMELKAVDSLAPALRVARRRAALIIGLADLSGLWPIEQVTAALSAFARTALSAAVAHVLRVHAARGDLKLPHPDDPCRDSGYILLGMGKLGAGELNYSSDVDLIVLYDSDKVCYRHERGPQEGYVRITRDLVRLLDERRAEGYVFRTDLRLRPDPSSTPLALPVTAALTYYESLGQNWERAAMIKARPVAGDLAAGDAFIEEMRPFIWRKNLDFWAIQDIHSIKRRIHAHKGGATIALAGHNIKLGRGGIREIEFFAQVHQLIWGGRLTILREPATLAALDALATEERITRQACDDLSAAYRYLRQLEHRLQMVDDRQTHSLPEQPEALAAVAGFMGYPDLEAFETELMGHLRCVERHYAALFEDTPEEKDDEALLLTGAEPDPETLTRLKVLGFAEPEQVVQLVRRWHSGRYRATRSTRSREFLTEMAPPLLSALARTANPDRALILFDRFLAGLPAGVQLFAMLCANPRLLNFLVEVIGGAPAIAERLSQKPDLLEAVLTPEFFEPLPERAVLTEELGDWLSQARDFQDVLDLTRRWNNDQRFRVGSQILHNSCDVDESGRAFSAIADAVLKNIGRPVSEAFAANHGRVADSQFVVLALGRLGAEQLTVASDLDLIFLYDLPEGANPNATQSDGPKALDATTYFARLAQRYINALTAPTGEGLLYELDMRLRPSGRSGPIAVTLQHYVRYQEEQAWTWEHMALTRARVVFGDPALAARIEQAVLAILTAPRDPDKLLHDVADMRRRLLEDRGTDNPWQIKNPRGGMVDLEFLSQYLQLRHAHDAPAVLSRSAAGAFAKLADAGLLGGKEAETLIAGTRLLRQVEGALLLTYGPGFDETEAPEGVKQQLAQMAGLDDFAALRAELVSAQQQAYDLFRKYIEEPAAKLGNPDE